MTNLPDNIIHDSDEIIGDIEYIHDFYSTFLKNERDIIVWLPPSYFTSSKSYPVLYMHDGQNLFDPNTSFIGYDWKVDETLTTLIRDRMINEVIVVGIYNTKARLKEYNFFTSRGKKYSLFLIKELKPYIDENYRTLRNSNNTALIGSSLGGLISFQLLQHYPNVFGKAACMSNSFWVDNGKIFKSISKNGFDEKALLYIDCGNDEKELIADNRKMCKKIKSQKIFTNGNFYCQFFPDAKHNEHDWAKRLHIPLIFLFGTKNGKRQYLAYKT